MIACDSMVIACACATSPQPQPMPQQKPFAEEALSKESLKNPLRACQETTEEGELRQEPAEEEIAQ